MVIGDTLKLTCKGSESTVEIKWKKNGVLVTSGANIKKQGIRTSTLVVEEVDISDSGNFSCEAHNQAGFMSSTVEIKVRGKSINMRVLSLQMGILVTLS